jgi:hypothetical protein
MVLSVTLMLTHLRQKQGCNPVSQPEAIVIAVKTEIQQKIRQKQIRQKKSVQLSPHTRNVNSKNC